MPKISWTSKVSHYTVFQGADTVALPLPPFCVVVVLTLLEGESHSLKAFSHCFVLMKTWFTRANLFGHKLRVWYLHSLLDLLAVFFYLGALTLLLFNPHRKA